MSRDSEAGLRNNALRRVAHVRARLAGGNKGGSMTREERALRANIVAKARWMNASGLNQGTSGNISARYKDVLLITPSATPYDSMTPEIDRRDAARGRVRLVERTPETIDGMAVSLRHYEVAAGRRRDRPHAFDLCDGPGDSPQGDTGLPLHDRGLRRNDGPLRRLCALRHEGAVGPCS